MNKLHTRILEISKKYDLSHLGSNMTAVDIIDGIYKIRREDEPFVLSAGHMGLALYCVIEKYYGINAEKIFKHHGTHPDKCDECRLFCSTGSLGHGLPISVAMALSDRSRNVFCLLSDGELFEGTVWESANVIEKYKVRNLRVYVNYNGFSAYDTIDKKFIDTFQKIIPQAKIIKTDVADYGLEGILAHYIKA